MGKIAKIMSVIVLSVCMVIAFCACGSPSPTDAADSFLNAVKTQDQETLNSVYDSESFNILDSMGEDGIASNENESEDNVFANEMKDKMLARSEPKGSRLGLRLLEHQKSSCLQR